MFFCLFKKRQFFCKKKICLEKRPRNSPIKVLQSKLFKRAASRNLENFDPIEDSSIEADGVFTEESLQKHVYAAKEIFHNPLFIAGV